MATYQDQSGYSVTTEVDDDGDAISVRICNAAGKVAHATARTERDVVDPVPAAYAAKLRQMGATPADFVKVGQQVVRRVALSAIREGLAELKSHRDREAAMMAANVPGLEELRAAVNAAEEEVDRHDREFGEMMEDEYNDGARPPKPVNSSRLDRATELRARYPRAAMYLRAENQGDASNHHKASAGAEAMKLIASGGDIERAAQILENWLPESAAWD